MSRPQRTSSSRTNDAYQAIRADVLACRLKPAEKLIISELCGRFGVSLGAVREALSRLTSEGFVTAAPQRGFRVAPISKEDLKDLTETRAIIESQCLVRSVRAGDATWEDRLVAIHHELANTPERVSEDESRLSETWARLHADFHAALVDACDSQWLLRLRSLLYAQSERYRRLSIPLAREGRDIALEHRRLMEAALAREVRTASRLLREHLTTTTRILLTAPIVASAEGGA